MPSPQQVQRAIDLIGRSSANCNYFFTKLDDTTWLQPLIERGIFEDPPSLISDSEGIIRPSHIWPQSNYFQRMAKVCARPVQTIVMEIMLKAGGTNNYFIHADFSEAALAMPADLAAQWAEHETQWLSEGNQIQGFLDANLGRLISKLAKEGKPTVALKLASELLAVLPDPEEEKKRHPKNEAERIVFSSLQPSIRCEQYNYEQMLKENISDLADVVPFETLELLCSLLKKAVLFSQPEEEWNKSHDATYLWRPAIEDHEQNDGYTIYDPLITAVRDTAEAICKRDPEKIGEVVECVEGFKWDIFRRMGLHLLRVAVNPPIAMVEERLVNEELSNHPGVHHEYFHLIQTWFGRLPSEGQQRILSWIEDAAPEKKYLAEHEDKITEEQKAKRISYWQYTKFIPIEKYLTGKWKQRFARLKGELKDAAMPSDFLVHSGFMSSGPESPKKPEQLARMSMAELIAYLKTWKPSAEWGTPTPDSLGSAVGAVVAEQPGRYADEIERFMNANMDPTYVRHVISGFCRALESGKPLPYAQVYKLCKWIVDQPTDIPDRVIAPERLRGGLDVDRNRRNAKIEIARFVEKSLEGKTKLPFELRKEVWSIIRPLTNDQEPNVEYEEKYGGKNMDPLTLSLNTIRGKALHAMMYYAMWIYHNVKEDIQTKENRTPSFKDMPEVLDVLDWHLDPNVDRSQTIRAVYGNWLPQLVRLGPEWVKANLFRIFPREPDLKPLRDAVWHTYLLYGGQIYTSVTNILMEIYREEVLRLKGKQLGDNAYKSPEARLAGQVLILYLWGEYGLEGNSLIDLFFKTAPPQLTAHALDFIARDTYGATASDPTITERMKALWDWRVEQVGGPDKMPKEELSVFGWWFAGGQFDAAWAFRHLEETLQRTGVSRSSMQVCEQLSALFSNHPHKALQCLRLFIDHNTDPWFFQRVHKQKGAWTLLEQAMDSKDETIRNDAEDIIHLLGSKGYLAYRELRKSRRRDQGRNQEN